MSLQGTTTILSCLAKAMSLEAQAAVNLDKEEATVELLSKDPREDVDGVRVEKEENVKGLVRKLKGFISMNLSNPK